MQPFGLLQLLQSFLPLNDNANTAEITPANAPEQVEKEAETIAAPLPNEAAPTYSAAQNAVLGFMDAHERRAKRLR